MYLAREEKEKKKKDAYTQTDRHKSRVLLVYLYSSLNLSSVLFLFSSKLERSCCVGVVGAELQPSVIVARRPLMLEAFSCEYFAHWTLSSHGNRARTGEYWGVSVTLGAKCSSLAASVLGFFPQGVRSFPKMPSVLQLGCKQCWEWVVSRAFFSKHPGYGNSLGELLL